MNTQAYTHIYTYPTDMFNMCTRAHTGTQQHSRVQSPAPSATYKTAPEFIPPPAPEPFTPRNDNGANAMMNYGTVKPAPTTTCVLACILACIVA